MSSKLAQRSLALGALMAFVITGQAMAAQTTAVDASVSNQNITEDVNIISGAPLYGSYTGGVYANAGNTASLSGKDISIKLDGGANNIFAVRAGNTAGNDGGTVILGDAGSNITIDVNGSGATIGLIAHRGPALSNNAGTGSKIIVNGDTLTINAKGSGVGVYALSADDTANMPENLRSEVTINSKQTVINSEGSAIAAFSKGIININGDLEVNAPVALEVRGHSTTNINASGGNKVVLNGNISFATPGDQYVSGNIIDANVNINLDNPQSSWKGNVIKDYPQANAGNSDFTTANGFSLNLQNGAEWTPTAVKEVQEAQTIEGPVAVNNLNLSGGVINLTKSDIEGTPVKAVIDKLEGTGGTFNVSDLTAKAEVTTVETTQTKIAVNGSGEIADKIAKDASVAKQLVNTVQNKKDGTAVTNSFTTDEGAVAGKMSGEVVTNADGTSSIKNLQEATYSDTAAIGDAGVNFAAHWRAHMNDMNKRLGDLRDANGERGAWVRMVRGESEYGAAKSQYNQYQLGFDGKLSSDKSWTVGAAVTFAEGDGSYTTGTTDDDSKALAIYGSKLNDDGTFIDLIARYARLSSDVNDKVGKGDYSTNGYSVSAEYGKRLTKDNGFWLEPQVELTYGSLDSANFKLGNKAVRMGGMDSLIGRLGFRLGKDIKQGNVYARASYLYDFDGETSSTFTANGVTRTIKEDLGGGWWEVGVGTNINLSKATYLYADVEKTFSGKLDTNWQWNLGIRYSF